MPKLLVVSRSFPPVVSGSAILMHNIMEEYPGDVKIVAGTSSEAYKDKAFKSSRTVSRILLKPKLFQRIFDKYLYRFISIIQYFIKFHVQNYKPTVILAVFPKGEFLIAAYKVAKALNIPLIVHFHDLWGDNYREGSKAKKLSDKYERIIVEYASKVYCMTSSQKDFLESKHNIQCELLEHSVPSQQILDITTNPVYLSSENRGNIRKIVYTGNISHKMNIDAMRVFKKAVELLPDNYEVLLYTSLTKEQLIKEDLYNSRMKLGWATKSEIQGILHKSDVLFLPLSFKNCAHSEVKTVYATKTLDYLISGSPILVFSPSDSFHSISAKAGGWGHVVDKDDPEMLAEQLQYLVNNKELALKVIEGAKREALRRSSDRIAKVLVVDVKNISKQYEIIRKN